MQTHKILFAASEAHPLLKTGGLADVAGSLPVALKSLRQDVRLIIPAYRDVLARAGTGTPWSKARERRLYAELSHDEIRSHFESLKEKGLVKASA